MKIGDVVKCQRARIVEYNEEGVSPVEGVVGKEIWVVAQEPVRELITGSAGTTYYDGPSKSYMVPLISKTLGICSVFQGEVELLPIFSDIKVEELEFTYLPNIWQWMERLDQQISNYREGLNS